MAQFSWYQKALILPPLVIGGLLLALAPGMKAEPTASTQATGKKVVRVLKVVPRFIQPTAEGYGYTEPSADWEAQSEIESRIVWVNESFREGNILKQGTEILRLDASAYELEVARLDAELDVSAIKDKTIADSLVIATKDFDLQNIEYQRIQKLYFNGQVSKTEQDSAERQLLSSQQQLQILKNNLAINRAEHQVLTVQKSQAQRNLERTIIVAPFDIRITQTLVGIEEYISKGEVLLRADGISAVEVKAQFPLGKMRPLHNAEGSTVGDTTQHNNLIADVSLNAGERLVHWEAEVVRTGGQVDAQTQSQAIIVSIQNPFAQALPGQQPPLIRDTFVKVTLKAPTLKNKILIPENAAHEGNVYTVSSDGTLEIKPIEIEFIQNQVVVVKSGLDMGDVVVLSQLSPAVKGMSLKPQLDKGTMAWLEQVTGFKTVKNDTTEKSQ